MDCRNGPHVLAEGLRLEQRAKIEAAIARWKQMIGDGLRTRTDERRAIEVEAAAHVLNGSLDLGRPSYVRTV